MRARCSGLANTHHEVGSGTDLQGIACASVDLVYGVDSFPYIVGAGGAHISSTFAEVARVLAPEGDFLIFNYSYRGDARADALDVQRLARQHGFQVLAASARPFRLWDGAVFRLRREA